MSGRVRHNHDTRDIKPKGICPACDRMLEAWEKAKEQGR